MPIISVSQLQPSYDVIVVGSGAGGGQSAYTLTMNGAKVLMLEAGRNYDPVTETPMFQTNATAPLRGTSTSDKPFGFHDSTIDGGWNVPGEPYTNASDDPKEQFTWWRPRMLGGRTNHWRGAAGDRQTVISYCDYPTHALCLLTPACLLLHSLRV